MEEEIWKDIPGYEGLFQASTFGRIKSLEKLVHRKNNRYYIRNEKIIKTFISNSGYERTQLYKNGIQKNFSVHRLVWLTFKGQIPEGMQINHIDENKFNNRLDNLELMTPKENANYGSRNLKLSNANKGQKPSEYAIKRSKELFSKPVIQYDKKMNFIKEYPNILIASKEVGLKCSSGIGHCCNGKKHYNTAGGFIWRYKEEGAC